MNKLTSIFFALALLIAVPAFAVPLDGDNNFRGGIAFGKISGSNSSDINGSLSLSRYVDLFETKEWLPEFGIRQGGSYTFNDDSRDQWLLDTEAFANINYVNEETFWVPYVGVGVGGAYNDQASTGTVSPQGGVKFFVTEQAYIDTGVRYTFPMSDNELGGNNALVAGLGVGFVWGGDRRSVDEIPALEASLDTANQCCARGAACCDKFEDVLKK